MEEIKINKIYNMDCLELMRKLPDEYFDLIITDPPYGLNINQKNASRGKLAIAKDYGKCEWDKEIPSAEHFKEMLRVSKNQIIFGGNYFTDYLYPSSCWIVWDKDNGDNDFADCELGWVSFPKAVRKFKFRWNGMLQENMKWKDKRVHPTQKPKALGRWILQKFAIKGDLIFDPFAGSGSFLIACKELGFDFVGCEIDKDYCEIINERLMFKTVADFTQVEPKAQSLNKDFTEILEISQIGNNP